MNLTKKIDINSDALDVIAGMEWEENGRGDIIGRLTSGQLDRKLYLEVNKGLEALEGKWSRKETGHIFKIDPRPEIEALLNNGFVTVEKDGFFETPVIVTMKMLARLNKPYGRVLEPSAGLGAIAAVLIDEGVKDLTLIEKNQRRCDALTERFNVDVFCTDFLRHTGQYDTIVMNPPFELGQDVDHITHAFNNCLVSGGQLASVISESPFFRTEQKYIEFRQFVDLYGLSRELPPNSFRESGTGVNTRIVWLIK